MSTPRPGQGESTTDLAWDGQTMIYENGRLLAESERFPKGARRSVADVDLDLLRAERLRMGTFDDNRRAPPGRAGVVPAHRFPCSTRRPATSACGGEVERFPFVPATRSGWNRTATRPTTSRSPGWSSGCGR